MYRWLAPLCLLCANIAGAEEYLLGVGDKIKISVYDQADLSGDRSIGGDCKFRLGLIGEVEACGKTAAQIAESLETALKGDYLVNPTVEVSITEYRSQRVDVFGQVKNSGPIYLRGPTSLLELISMAGGPSDASVAEVLVSKADGSQTMYTLDGLREMPVYASAGSKVELQIGDRVFIGGEVMRPGAVAMSENLTINQALDLAGGPKEYANLRRVTVRRDGKTIKVNVTRIRQGRDPEFMLEDGDHIGIPRGAF